MTTNPPQSLHELTEYFRNRIDCDLGMPRNELSSTLASGLETEPENFPRFVDAWIAYAVRTCPDQPEEEIRATALENLAMLALTADHGKSILGAARKGEHQKPADFFYDPNAYGSVMRALAQHLKVREGRDCAELVLKEKHRRTH